MADLPELDLISLAHSHGFKHIVQKSQAETIRELRAACLMIEQPEKFLDFPISSTLKPRNASAECEADLTLFEKSFATLADKEYILNSIELLFDQARLNGSLRDDVILTADELICNALFNAPCEDGNNLSTLAQTLERARNTPTRDGQFKIGAYKGYLALTCQDSYGHLQPKKVLNRVLSCLQNGPAAAMNFQDSGTSGIGSFMIFSACTSLFMSVKQNQTSQFCALFPLTESAKARMQKPKNLHWSEL